MDKDLEIKRIKRKFDIISNYFKEKGTIKFGLEEASRIVNGAFHDQKIGIMRRIDQELNIWIKGIPKDNQEELINILKSEFGEQIELTKNAKVKVINRIISKGVIINAKEYEIILQHVEEIYSDNRRKEELIILNKLLADYHKRTDILLK